MSKAFRLETAALFLVFRARRNRIRFSEVLGAFLRAARRLDEIERELARDGGSEVAWCFSCYGPKAFAGGACKACGQVQARWSGQRRAVA